MKALCYKLSDCCQQCTSTCKEIKNIEKEIKIIITKYGNHVKKTTVSIVNDLMTEINGLQEVVEDFIKYNESIRKAKRQQN